MKGPSQQDIINARLANSGAGRGTNPDQTVKTGDSARRVFTNIHKTAVKQHGDGGPPKPQGRGLDVRGKA